MSKCGNCQYVHTTKCKIKEKSVEISACTLTNYIVEADAEQNCSIYNKDLTAYSICYNCIYYIGGGDWGLFCSHKDKCHHLGKFGDKACKYFARKHGLTGK